MKGSDLRLTGAEIHACVKVLSKFNSRKTYPLLELPDVSHLIPIIQNLHRLGRNAKKKRLSDLRAQGKLDDQQARNTCALRAGRAKQLQQLQLTDVLVPDGPVDLPSITSESEMPALSSSAPRRLTESVTCYICKLKFRTLHFFYDRLCPTCAPLNFEKRLQTADLTGRVALVTGGRIKIGYRVVLKLLRAHCFVIVTTRFPMDCLLRLKDEQDFDQWKDRVHVYGVDFRYGPLIESFASMLTEKYPRLDFLINNACQTIQRTKDFYRHLIHNERLVNYSLLPADQQSILDGNRQFYEQMCPQSHQLSHTPVLPLLNDSNPSDSTSQVTSIAFDVHHQPIDFRSTNSWLLHLDELNSAEIHDVFTINALAPFILNGKLKVLMSTKHPDPDSVKFVINVSAMEGSFSRKNKTDRHPHTNAAKAALNMMTRTSATDYRKSNIYMVSVDTGRSVHFSRSRL